MAERGKVAWSTLGMFPMAASLHPETSPQPIPCQHQTRCSPHHISMFRGECFQFATGMMGCDIWALDALWKKQMWPESAGDDKGHLAFVGE